MKLDEIIYGKHIGVYSSKGEFDEKFNPADYVEPWVVYIVDGENIYDIIYSNDQDRQLSSMEPDFQKMLENRVSKLENEKVYCTELEYEILVSNGFGWVTNIDGTKSEVSFDVNKIYYIYEDDEIVVEPEEPIENSGNNVTD